MVAFFNLFVNKTILCQNAEGRLRAREERLFGANMAACICFVCWFLEKLTLYFQDAEQCLLAREERLFFGVYMAGHIYMSVLRRGEIKAFPGCGAVVAGAKGEALLWCIYAGVYYYFFRTKKYYEFSGCGAVAAGAEARKARLWCACNGVGGGGGEAWGGVGGGSKGGGCLW